MLGKLDRRKGRFGYFGYVLFRFLKLSPVMLATLGLYWLTPLILDGPFALEQFDPWQKSCQFAWKAQLFMVQNWFFDLKEEMMVVSDNFI